MIESRVREYIEREQLLPFDGKHLVAVSGGADSVALLIILLRLDYQVEAVHCNFHLRGEESNRDEEFVKSLCEKFEVPLHLIHFDTKTYAEFHQISIEMAARELRYGYFEQLRSDIGAECVCVAHHRDDAAETLLLNLLRGAGIHGLTGIRPRNGHVVRPLLCLSRQEIVCFLEIIGQDYVTDSSNLEADVRRNQIRLKVMPLLEQYFPAASEKIALAANHLAEAERVYDGAIESARKRLWHDNAIDTTLLLREPSPRTTLFELLSPLGFSSAVVRQLFDSLQSDSGRFFASDSHEAVTDRGRIVVAPRRPLLQPLRMPEPGVYHLSDDTRFHVTITEGTDISRDSLCATLDADKLHFPLTVRTAQAGDRFIPFGMNGSRLVSDFLTDRKVPLTEKRRQLVVTDSEGRIIWIVGHRTDQRCCVDSTTRRILRMEINR